jgi:hypothetical protein
MARLYLFAEGQTEETFADTVLKPHLARLGVYLTHIILVAHKKKKGRVHRGGGRSYLPMKNDITRFLAQDQNSNAFFTIMLDLYGIPGGFPKLDESEKLRQSPYNRVEFLKRAFATDVGDSRFIPYIQLHEYETYLFSDASALEYFYDHHAKQIANLKAVADNHATPELIDDGPQSAPSKRIIEQLPDYADAKPVVGPQVAELIGLPVILGKCPHFDAWLSRLEKL